MVQVTVYVPFAMERPWTRTFSSLKEASEVLQMPINMLNSIRKRPHLRGPRSWIELDYETEQRRPTFTQTRRDSTFFPPNPYPDANDPDFGQKLKEFDFKAKTIATFLADQTIEHTVENWRSFCASLMVNNEKTPQRHGQQEEEEEEEGQEGENQLWTENLFGYNALR